MATAIQSNFRIRKNLGRIQRVIEVPNLIDIQKSSYDKFLQSTIPQNDRQETGLQAGERTRVRLPVEHDAVRDELLHLLRFAERNHHLGERGGQPFHHVAKQDRVPDLDPRLRAAHAAAAASRKHEQGGFHHDKSRLAGD